MATPYHHAVSSAKKHGGTWDQYIDIHNWFDETKAWVADIRHRTFRHHSEGIFECENKFGTVIEIILADGTIKNVPTRVIGEQHVQELDGKAPGVRVEFVRLDNDRHRVAGFKPGTDGGEHRLQGIARDIFQDDHEIHVRTAFPVFAACF